MHDVLADYGWPLNSNFYYWRAIMCSYTILSDVDTDERPLEATLVR